MPEGQKAYSMTKPIRFEHLQGCIDWWGGPKRKGRKETPQAWKVDIGSIIDEARTRAKPHWDQSERLARTEAALKARISDASADAKTLEDGPSSPEAERKVKALRADIAKWRVEAMEAGEASRGERSTGDAIYSAAFNLDIKNPHAVEEDHGDPEMLLDDLKAAEAETARVRDHLKAILAEALAR